jgi:hypothetical protein
VNAISATFTGSQGRKKARRIAVLLRLRRQYR